MRLIFLMLGSLIFSCCSKGRKIQPVREMEYYANGAVKSEWTEINGKKYGYQFDYFQNGNLKSILRYVDGVKNHEQLWFHENGFLSKKVLISNDTAQGMAYYFYPSGNLKADRYYRNDKPYISGVDYWDKEFGIIKYSLHFNEHGEIYYRKDFDSTGKFIGEEGRRDGTK